MKQIFLDIAGKRHSLYNNLIGYPPEGYCFVSDPSGAGGKYQFLVNSNLAYSLQKHVVSTCIPVNLVKSYLERHAKFTFSYELTYSSGHLIFRNEPWILDLEYATHISGYSCFHFRTYQKIIEKYLSSENCKSILPWTEAGRATFFPLIKDKKILEKIQVVNLAVPPKKWKKEHHDKEKIVLLFVTSSNIPKDFDIKGGKEVFAMFAKLSREYDNLELIVRGQVPEHIKVKNKSLKNVRIFENILSPADLELLFKTADIFLFPSYNTPGLVFLDAMSYELPIITTDVWANSEMVQNNINGILIPRSAKIHFFIKDSIPDWSSFSNLRIIKNNVDYEVVENLYEACKMLIENKNLRESMGKRGREEIEQGKFSLSVRNRKLKELFDQAGTS
jgi:glycosyltransferase involved in cell wall biosynthesis